MSEVEPGAATTDVALIRRWRGGEEQAATELVARHAPAVGRFVRRLGVRDDIEDVVQDTFIRAFRAMDGFRADASLRTWLFTIARRLVIDRQRQVGRIGPVVELDGEEAGTAYDALDALVARETSERIGAALAQLTRLQREVFLLRLQDGRSYREIAEIVGSTEGATRVHYHNAMRTIRGWLDA